MPQTAAGVNLDPTDPYASLDAAAKMDAQNLSKYQGDWSKTLAAYAGGGNVDKYGGVPPFAETQSYVKTIMGNAQQAAQKRPVRRSAAASIRPSRLSAEPLTRACKRSTPRCRLARRL